MKYFVLIVAAASFFLNFAAAQLPMRYGELTVILPSQSPFPGSLNKQPTVSISSPSNGSVLTTEDAVVVSLDARDPDGSISKYGFQLNSNGWREQSSASINLGRLSVGEHLISARAKDNLGKYSNVAFVTLIITKPKLSGKVSIYPDSEKLTSAQVVTLEYRSQPATLEYSVLPLTGACSSTRWSTYRAPITLDGVAKVCARATKAGWDNSKVSIKEYRSFAQVPDTITPYINYEVGSNLIELVWESDSNELHYLVESKKLSEEIWQSEGRYETAQPVTFERASGTYLFKLKACNNDGCSAWSSPQSVIVVVEQDSHQCPAWL
ncbi:Ig-like domain-containing protein [Pseudoalteromonas sp. CnMc7-15]|uniref:Ig-like domain-containing protein n=1 Tax=unclassified Pseudoalteromonas TaxID=194690 RepID=UPI001EF570E0|nr:Ig-like domain-containing protein [Pseudoalteromonas sp. CnMc7-15]MCG7566174.1 Ig-like domain-containing protein [Pseudoalteromonas sp. CnMc7-15]